MEQRSPDSVPQGILDTFNGQLFDVSIKSLIHVGVWRLRLFQEDLENEEVDEEKFHLLGRPSIPGIFLLAFTNFLEPTKAEF